MLDGEKSNLTTPRAVRSCNEPPINYLFREEPQSKITCSQKLICDGSYHI